MTNRSQISLATIGAILLLGVVSRAQDPAQKEPAPKDPAPQAPVEKAPVKRAPAEEGAVEKGVAEKEGGPKDKRSHPRTRAQLGIEFAVTASKIRRSIISTKTPHGFAVRKVTKGSLADQAELARGTIILEVDGKPLKEVSELEAVLEHAKPGQKIELLCSKRKKTRRLLDRKPWVRRKVILELPIEEKDGATDEKGAATKDNGKSK